jgi:hypothetical protein
MKTIKLESYQIEENYKCTDKQFAFIKSLMNKTKHEEVFLNKLAFGGREKLTISSASKLIDCLKNKEDFELVEKPRENNY